MNTKNLSGRLKLIFSMYLAMVFLLSSCAEDAPTGLITVNKVFGVPISDSTSLLIGGLKFDSLEDGFIDRLYVEAQLANGSGIGIDGGDILFGSATLDKMTDNGFTSYGHWNTGTSIIRPNMNGGLYYFQVTGSSSFGASLLIDVTNPNGHTQITSPSLMDTVSRTNGFTTTWNRTAATDTVQLSLIRVDSINIGSTYHVLTTDDGSHTFNPSDISNVPTGKILLVVSRINWNFDTTSGRHVFAGIVSEQSKELILD
ncbi:MAG: hypothetical protein J4G05_07935 [Chlorobi bacterium]|nr:hypothetical protein [Chlorobiota bacterium]